ncbi:hypothetical protein FOL47_005003 [Perkinsus chesapeaki]|uniref:Uncharacterized protein n=1 Tax=Perkinsus chesapeaki TaxID=330153 RepID=A0A7J6LZV4_PERCH|nr:hypothetical protein FOL47_005003 [Perkinsus chesapeaki]
MATPASIHRDPQGDEEEPPHIEIRPEDPQDSSTERRGWRESAAAFTDQNELRQELRKARSYRGRVRTQLKNVREAMDNIIGDSEDDHEALEELHRRERESEKALEEAITYIVELEFRSEELMNMRAVTNISTSTSHKAGEREAASIADVRRSLKFDENPRTSETLSDGQPEVVNDLISVLPSPRPQSNGERTTRRHCDAGVVGKLSVVELKDSFKFPQHCRRLEEVLVEIGAGEFDVTGEVFFPHRDLRHTCTQKLLPTLQGCPTVYDRALALYEIHGDRWGVIVGACKKQFAKRPILLEELKERLKKLKFPGVTGVEIYLKDIIAVNELYRIVHQTDTAQRVQFVRKVLAQLPREVVVGVIRRCRERCAAQEGDWEVAVEFHSLDGSTEATLTEFIKTECRLLEEADCVKKEFDPHQDSVRSVQTPVEGHDSSSVARVLDQSLPRVRATDWVKGFAVAYGVAGRGCRDKKSLFASSQPDGFLPRTSQAGRTYYILGYKDESVAKSKISGLSKDLFRTWRFQERLARTGGRTQTGRPLETLIETRDGVRLQDSVATGCPSELESYPTYVSNQALSGSIDRLFADNVCSLSSCEFKEARRVMVPPEIIVGVSVRFGAPTGGKVLPGRCVLDTAAGGSYLLVPSVECLSDIIGVDPVRLSKPVAVTLADGVNTQSLGCRLEACVMCFNRVNLTRLRILPNPTNSTSPHLSILAGRSLIADWGILIVSSLEAYAGPGWSRCIYRAPVPVQQILTESVAVVVDGTQRPHDTLLAGRTAPLQTCCPKFSEDEKAFIHDLLSELVPESWVTVPSTCGMYQARVRAARVSDRLDLPNQRFICEVMVPKVENPSQIRCRSYAVRLHERLTPKLKSVYRDLVEAYVDSKFWEPKTTDRLHKQDELPGAQVFLLPGGSRKPRLVVDMRDIIERLPKASSNPPSLWLPIVAMRALGGRLTVIGDARAAFYKVRLVDSNGEPYVLTLDTGIGTFQSSRLVFGIVVGPSGLSANLGRLIDLARSCGCQVRIVPIPGGFAILIIFVDDVALSGEVRQVLHRFRITLGVMELAGFDAQVAKVHVLSCDAVKEDVHRALATEFSGSPPDLAKEGSLLGMMVRYEGLYMVMVCKREKRMLVVRDFVEHTRSSSLTSKRQVFQAAGCLAFDPARQHVLARACADSLRSLVGRQFAKIDWLVEIHIQTLNHELQCAYLCLIEWMAELLVEVCDHRSDASLSGGGYVVYRVDSTSSYPLFAESFRFKAGELKWHSNRREYRNDVAIDATCEAVEIQLYCDNAACVSWSGNVDSAEILGALHEELLAIRRLAKVDIRHVQGSSNETADSLSRVFDRKVPGTRLTLAECLSKGGGENEIYARDPSYRRGQGWPRVTSALQDDPLVSEWEPAGEQDVILQEDDNVRALAEAADTTVEVAAATEPAVRLALSAIENGASAYDVVSFIGIETDSLFRIAPPSRSCELQPLVERGAKVCYDLSSLRRVVWGACCVLDILRANATKKPVQLRRYDPAAMDKLVCRSAQLYDEKYSSEVDADDTSNLRPCGPLFRLEVDGTTASYLAYRTGHASGRVSFLPILPKSAKDVRSLVVRTAHRETRHSAIPGTCSAICDFHMKGAEQVAKRLIQTCLTCQLARARRVWVTPPSLGKGHVERLKFYPPYYRCGVDYYALGEGRKVISVTCLVTGHTCWKRAPREDLSTVMMTLRKVQLEMGGLKELVVDAASYFSTQRFSALCDESLGAQVEPLSVRSPFEGGRYEKVHDLGGRKLRVMLRGHCGKVADLTDDDLDLLLLEVCLLLNTRPTLSYYHDAEGQRRIVTPDSLCWGYTRASTTAFGYAKSADPIRPGRDALIMRREFVDYHWIILKERALESVRHKCPKGKTAFSFEIGSAALVYAPVNRKLGFDWRVGHVIAIRGDHTVDIIFPGKQQRVTRENIYNLLPVTRDMEQDCLDLDESDDPMLDCTRDIQSSPNRIGMPIKVKLRVRGERGLHWYEADVIREFKSGHVQVRWRDGSPDERLWLDGEQWELGDSVGRH